MLRRPPGPRRRLPTAPPASPRPARCRRLHHPLGRAAECHGRHLPQHLWQRRWWVRVGWGPLPTSCTGLTCGAHERQRPVPEVCPLPAALSGWSNAAKLELVGQTIASRAYQMHKGAAGRAGWGAAETAQGVHGGGQRARAAAVASPTAPASPASPPRPRPPRLLEFLLQHIWGRPQLGHQAGAAAAPEAGARRQPPRLALPVLCGCALCCRRCRSARKEPARRPAGRLRMLPAGAWRPAAPPPRLPAPPRPPARRALARRRHGHHCGSGRGGRQPRRAGHPALLVSLETAAARLQPGAPPPTPPGWPSARNPTSPPPAPPPRHTVKLYTFGQPRVGDRAHAEIIEEYIGERFRILNNADPAGGSWAAEGDWRAGGRWLPKASVGPACSLDCRPKRRCGCPGTLCAGSMPPSQVDLDNDLSLVNVLAAQAVSAATSGEPLLTSVGAWAAVSSALRGPDASYCRPCSPLLQQRCLAGQETMRPLRCTKPHPSSCPARSRACWGLATA